MCTGMWGVCVCVNAHVQKACVPPHPQTSLWTHTWGCKCSLGQGLVCLHQVRTLRPPAEAPHALPASWLSFDVSLETARLASHSGPRWGPGSWLSSHQEIGMRSNQKVRPLPCRGRLLAKPRPLQQQQQDRLASPRFPLSPPNHKQQGANGEWPDEEHFNVIYLLIRKHKFAFLFNWLSDLWEFYCKWSTALIGYATAVAAWCQAAT